MSKTGKVVHLKLRESQLAALRTVLRDYASIQDDDMAFFRSLKPEIKLGDLPTRKRRAERILEALDKQLAPPPEIEREHKPLELGVSSSAFHLAQGVEDRLA